MKVLPWNAPIRVTHEAREKRPRARFPSEAEFEEALTVCNL